MMNDVLPAEYKEYFSTVVNKDPGDPEKALWDSDEE
jgi:hypothetical protein